MATTKRSKGPARWLVVGLSGLATAGFLSAIVTKAVQDETAPAPIAASVTSAAPVVTQTYPPAFDNPTISRTAAQVPVNTQPVVRAPRLRTRGS